MYNSVVILPRCCGHTIDKETHCINYNSHVPCAVYDIYDETLRELSVLMHTLSSHSLSLQISLYCLIGVC